MSAAEIRHWGGEPPTRFQLMLRDIVSLIAVIGLGVGYLLTRENNSANQNANLKALAESMHEMAQTVKDMNREGTAGSQKAIEGIHQSLASLDRRDSALETSVWGPNGLNEKFTDVQAKLNLIANLLEGKKGAK